MEELVEFDEWFWNVRKKEEFNITELLNLDFSFNKYLSMCHMYWALSLARGGMRCDLFLQRRYYLKSD